MLMLAEKVTSGLRAAVKRQKSRLDATSINKKEHTYCFMCARTYFSRVLERCLRCGSDSVQHYTSHDLSLLAHRPM